MTLPPELEQLARLVAGKSGKTLEEVLKEALEARAREVGIAPKDAGRKPSVERMMAISERFAGHPVLDSRTPEEIIGYDQFGVPR
jgi:antitoxin VapB